MSMAKTKATTMAKTKATARAKAIKLMVNDNAFTEEWEEYAVGMKDTLSDLVAFIREDGEAYFQADGADLNELYVTTAVGLKSIPMKVKIAKLIQDGLISDGSHVLFHIRPWASKINARR
jgi:hypothetical protein